MCREPHPVVRLWAVLLVAPTASRGGNVNQSTSNLFNVAGDNGFYWSSTPNSSASNAYDLRFNGTSNINPSDNNNRQNGFSVRCTLLCPISKTLWFIAAKSRPFAG